MTQEAVFCYKYSAKRNSEIEAIRNKYLPQSENKLEELKRLDGIVQRAGIVESLCAGIGGLMLFGIAMCLSLEALASGIFFVLLGIPFAIAGIIGMISAYPIYRKVFNRTKAKYTDRILKLAEELGSKKSV